MEKNTCNICKIRAYIQCDQCKSPLFFCSRGHLSSHKIKIHLNRKDSNISSVKYKNDSDHKSTLCSLDEKSQIDLRKLFQYIQNYKKEIEIKINNKEFIDAIVLINKCIPLSKKFYQEDHASVK